MEFSLFETVETDLPFSTYVPEDMAAETFPSGDGTAVRFVAEFGGQRNDKAQISVRFPPADMTETDAIASLQETAEELGLLKRGDDTPDRYAWSLAEADFAFTDQDGTAIVGHLALGRHNDRFFELRWQHPEEYGDGFGPRAHRILEEWLWTDTSTWLATQAAKDKPYPNHTRQFTSSENLRIFTPLPASGVRDAVRVAGEARVPGGILGIELEDGHDILAVEEVQVETTSADWSQFDVTLDYDVPTNPVGTLIFYYEDNEGNRVEELMLPVVFLDEDIK